MSITVEQLTEYALALPDDARTRLADRLAESLDPNADEDVRQSWAVEAQRRLAEVRSGQVDSIPGPEALEEVRRSVAQ